MSKLSNPILKSSQYYTRPRIISINTFKILYFLSRNDGVAYFSDIKRYLDRSSSQISQTMKRLLNMDYIESNNSRPRKYIITKLGRKIQRQTIKGIVKGQDKILKNFKKSQKPNLDREICFARLKPVRRRIDSSKSSPFKLRLKSMENDRVPLF